MGSMVFLIPRRNPLPREAVECAYMVGSDGIPWETQVAARDDRLVVTRQTPESGRFVVPWPLAKGRCMALSTATLISSEKPYHLALELSRGTLSQLQTQLALWESRGLPVSLEMQEPLERSLKHFVNASLSQSNTERCASEASASLKESLDLLDQLSRQVVAFCATNWTVPTAPGLWGTSLGQPAQIPYLANVLVPPVNICFVQPTWRGCEPNPGEWDWSAVDAMLQAARRSRARMACGPLLRISRDDLPDWLYLWGDDFDAIQSYVFSYVNAVVRQFSGRVSLWHCSAATNAEDALQMTEEQRLRLTVGTLETLRQADSRTPAIISIRQPWGEYLGRTAMDLSPWQFTDIVVRADLGLSGIGLELSVSCLPGKTLTRSLLEFSRMIDRWSVFGLPLVLFLSMPTPVAFTDAGQADLAYLEDLLRLLASRSSVHGIIWDQLCDTPAWSAGLLDSAGNAKPILRAIQQFRP